MTNHEPMTAAAPEPNASGLTPAQTIDLVEAWLRAEPGMRLGKARVQGQTLGVEVTRRHFFEAQRRLGITSPVAPQPDRRAAESRAPEPEAVAVAQVAPPPLPAPPKAERRARRRRGRRPTNLRDLSSLAENLEALVAERDRARAAVDQIRVILKTLR